MLVKRGNEITFKHIALNPKIKISFKREDIIKMLNCVTSLFFKLGVFAGGMSSFIDDGSSKDNKVISES